MMYKKYEQLKEIIASYESLVIAFSGGVDSAFLSKVAYEVLGKKALAVTIQTPYIAKWEIEDALRVAKEIGVHHEVIEKSWIETLRDNPLNRCYICKHALFSSLVDFAQQKGFSAVAEGSNVDDTKEVRPGRVALGELNIQTPLLDAGLSKEEIRILSQEMGLSTWNKPSYACLLTRFAHNQVIDDASLGLVDKAEKYMISQGYGQIRVRYEHKIARIEMPHNDALDLLNNEQLMKICHSLKALGFLHVTLDLEGYRYANTLLGVGEKGI